MGLPTNNQAWPPKQFTSLYSEYSAFSAWYAGDVDALMSLNAGNGTFWGRMAGRPKAQRPRLHVPLAADIAATNATLLFAEDPTIVIPEAHMEAEEEGQEPPRNADAEAAESRLREILAFGEVYSRFIEAAESCSAMGGVFLKTDWDTSFATYPLLSVVQADSALSEFRYGHLDAVTLWKVLPSDSTTTVWRHLERHETGPDGNGIILHGLYAGTTDRLGTRRDLSQHPETEGLPETVQMPFLGIAVRYIPNLKPNRRHRGQPYGRSDLAGAEALLDALDECLNSWMRDIRLAKARLVVPQESLELDTETGDFKFDADQEIYAPLASAAVTAFEITASQFAIRVAEHQATAESLIKQIILHAGYAPQTFGIAQAEGAITATEIRARERRSLMTQQMKTSFWTSALEDLLENMLIIDKEILGNPTVPFRPKVTMADSLIQDEGALADTVVKLNQAVAASYETRVRILHPDWNQQQIDAEVSRIKEEQGLSLPDAIQLGVA